KYVPPRSRLTNLFHDLPPVRGRQPDASFRRYVTRPRGMERAKRAAGCWLEVWHRRSARSSGLPAHSAAVCYNRAAPGAGAVARSVEGAAMSDGERKARVGMGVQRRVVLGALLPVGAALAACGGQGGTGAAPAAPAKPTGKIDFWL